MRSLGRRYEERIEEARYAARRWEDALHPRDLTGKFRATIDPAVLPQDAEPPPLIGSRFPSMTPRELQRVLRRAGWKLKRSKGSHLIFGHPAGGREVTVPAHARSMPRGTMMNVLRVAGMA